MLELYASVRQILDRFLVVRVERLGSTFLSAPVRLVRNRNG